MKMEIDENTFFTSDTHIGHKRIMEYQPNRRFGSLEEHDHALLTIWNQTIPPNARVFHLGDFFFYEKQKEYLSRLNGQIILVKGNHDHGKLDVPTFDYLELSYERNTIVLCHFPFEIWNKSHHGSYHFHGHCHGRLKSTTHRIDVGVDTNASLKPYNIKELIHG